MPHSTFIIVISIAATHFVAREAVFERASVRNAKIFFPPVLGLRAVFWFGTPMFLFAAYKVSGQVYSPIDWLYPIATIGLALGCFFSVPGTISLDGTGITMKRYLGLQVRRLSWADASGVQADARKELVVFGPDGTSIIHTPFHVDPSRFKLEISKRLRSPIIHR